MKRALISVANKDKLEVILEKLKEQDYEFISTGSTAKEIKSLGYEVLKVSDIINFEEILGGRVKTLHPNIHGGILSRRTQEDYEDLQKYNIEEIDVVVCNLYPFSSVIAKKDCTLEDAIENIDIGGVTLLRAAAKNNKYVSVLCDPDDYESFDMKNNLTYAIKAFEHTAYYDILIAKYLQKDVKFDSEYMLVGAKKTTNLRYGENSHQKASLYIENGQVDYSLGSAQVLHGKELSYNNIRDIDTALNLICEFNCLAAVALKHNVPCGVGFGSSLLEAYSNCYDMDNVSIFGGIVCFNGIVNIDVANRLNEIFLEVVIAKDFSIEALAKLKSKKNLRILKVKMDSKSKLEEVVSIAGGFLMQDKDQNNILEENLNIVTINKGSDKKFEMAKKAQIVCKYVKSNAIVIATKDKIIAQSGGQTSRVDAAKIALEKAKTKGYNMDLIMASDAFFPFVDNIELAYEYGVSTILQPGGSIKDDEVIAKCNELNIAMAMTSIRHFRH